VSATKRDEGTALLDRALSGDKEAFGLLAEEHRDGLLRLCYKMTGSPEEAEDLVQETLLKAYSKFGSFELRSSLATWLYRIATNACLDHQRARKPWDLDRRWQWFEENDALVRNVEQTMFLSPEKSAEVKEVAATCINCITMSLPAKQRAAVVLCDQIGLSREEAAHAIGASVASVKTELHRGRKVMTDVFEHHCALVDEKNECNACTIAGRIKRGARDERQAPATQRIAEQPMTCDDIEPLLSDLLDRELPDAERRRAESHIAECSGCAASYRALRRTTRFVQGNADTRIAPGTPGAAYASFQRATADESYGRSPAEAMFEGLAMLQPEGDER
jgi:RNA polymerase sigma-70 factor (ECF subfamily)